MVENKVSLEYRHEGFVYQAMFLPEQNHHVHFLMDLSGHMHTLKSFGPQELPSFEDVKEVIDVWRYYR